MKNTATLLVMKIFTPKMYDKYMRGECVKFLEEYWHAKDNNDVTFFDPISVTQVGNYTVNDLLDKINEKGVKSLTKDELSFLNNQ
jgi:hypothetical protein